VAADGSQEAKKPGSQEARKPGSQSGQEAAASASSPQNNLDLALTV